ncbi:hypothetical protein RF55_18831 [Lasius niger]|uniref:Uncharacterized protein n=1 Tax=Lasius niger TaxID=67767 RepID=A0A0J7K0R0_LASNI|nr:hypothetical protein RF55_18831 [Lasius niger]
MVDANYKFLMVDIGSYGKEGDNGILEKSNIGELIKKNEFYPSPTKLPNTQIVLPYVIVGDGALRLSTHMMKPFTRTDAHLDIKKLYSTIDFHVREECLRMLSEPLPTQNMISLHATGGFANAEEFDIRDKFMDYFSNAGSTQWQIKCVNRTNPVANKMCK